MFLLGPCGWQVRYGFEPSLRGVIEMRSQTRALTSDAVLRLYGWHLLAHLVEILKYVLSLSTFQYFSYFWFRRFRALLSTSS
jgi:hypothetical protein